MLYNKNDLVWKRLL